MCKTPYAYMYIYIYIYIYTVIHICTQQGGHTVLNRVSTRSFADEGMAL